MGVVSSSRKLRTVRVVGRVSRECGAFIGICFEVSQDLDLLVSVRLGGGEV